MFPAPVLSSLRSYLGLFVLQLLPSLLIGVKFASFLYFGLLAVSTVYLGAKRQDIPDVRGCSVGVIFGNYAHKSRIIDP